MPSSSVSPKVWLRLAPRAALRGRRGVRRALATAASNITISQINISHDIGRVCDSGQGEKLPHDKHFKGPLDSRSCTDILFLLLFIAFWAGMVGLPPSPGAR